MRRNILGLRLCRFVGRLYLVSSIMAARACFLCRDFIENFIMFCSKTECEYPIPCYDFFKWRGVLSVICPMQQNR